MAKKINMFQLGHSLLFTAQRCGAEPASWYFLSPEPASWYFLSPEPASWYFLSPEPISTGGRALSSG